MSRSKERTISKSRTVSKSKAKGLDYYLAKEDYIGSKQYDKAFKRSIKQLESDIESDADVKRSYEIYKLKRDISPIQVKINQLQKNESSQKAIQDKIANYQAKKQSDFVKQQILVNQTKLNDLQGTHTVLAKQILAKNGFEKKKAFDRKMKSFNGLIMEETTESRMTGSHMSHYEIPTPVYVGSIRPQLKRDRKKIKDISQSIQPTEVFYIPRKKSKYNWKPYRVELYGITSDELRKMGENSWKNNELVKINSIHGASHSLAMTEELDRNNIDYDFAYYSHVPIEFEGEKDYVKYYARHIYNKPLVIVNIEEEPEEIFRRKGAFPTDMKRWCVKEFKLQPFKAFLKEYFYSSVPNDEQAVLLQFLGIQAFHSPSRSEMIPEPTISDLSLEKMVVYQSLPVFDLSEKETDLLIKSGSKRLGKKIIKNCNECEFGRHGCITCSYAGWKYYQHLKENYPKEYDYVIKLRDASSERGMKKARRDGEAQGLSESEIKKLVAHKKYVVYQKDKSKLSKSMQEAGLTSCPY